MEKPVRRRRPAARRNFHRNRALLIGLIGLLALGVVAFFGFHLFQGIYWGYPDLNGPDNTSLSVISPLEVTRLDNRYTTLASGTSVHGTATGIQGALKNMDRSTCTFSARKVDGILTLQATLAQADTLTLNIDSQLKTGNTELFILVDGQIHSRLPANKAHTVTLEGIAGKTVLVKIAAERAELYATVERT